MKPLQDTKITDRQRALLTVVRDGRGDLHLFAIDQVFTRKNEPGPVTVQQELEQLRDQGLAVEDHGEGRYGRWTLTPAALRALDDAGEM